jgi:hypothetical protein
MQAGGRSLDVDEGLGAGQRQRSRRRVGHTQDTFVCACLRARTGARQCVGVTERRGKGAVTAEAMESYDHPHLVTLLVVCRIDENLVENLVQACSARQRQSHSRHWRAARGGPRAASGTRGRACRLLTGHVGNIALVQTDFSVVDPKLGAVHLCGPDVRVGAEQHVLELREFLVRLFDRLLLRGLLGGVRDSVLLGGEHIVVIDDGRRSAGALARALAERLIGLLDQCHACALVG